MNTRKRNRLIRLLVGALLQSDFSRNELPILLRELELDPDLWMQVSDAVRAAFETMGQEAMSSPTTGIGKDDEELERMYQLLRSKRIAISDLRDRVAVLNPTLSFPSKAKSMKELLYAIRRQCSEREFISLIENALNNDALDPYLRGIMKKDL